MIKIIIVILSVLTAISLKAQNGYGQCVLDTTYIMGSNGNYKSVGQTKEIRLIFHFLLKDDGTGNFNEVNDGLTPANDFNGYEYVEYIVDNMNNQISNTCEMRLQPNGIIPEVNDPEYRFKIAGTFFWRSTTNYNAGLSTLRSNYGKNLDKCINIFLIHDLASGGGYVDSYGSNSVYSGIHYQYYMTSITNNNMWYNTFTQKVVNHEIGHALNLRHTIMTGSGTCSSTIDDYCNDTPTIPDMLNIGEPNPCCWNDVHCSNNMMDYNADQCAITPDQLGIVHFELDNDKYYFWINHFNVSNINICDVNISDSYIAERVSFAEFCPATISNSSAVFVNASEVLFFPGFEIEDGSMLIIDTNESEF